MKSLEQLTNVDKARLLHELFREEVPALLQYTKEICTLIDRDKDTIKADWKNGLLTAEFWFTLSNSANRTIEKYAGKLEKSSRLFADQLFDGYAALFTVECIIKYASGRSDNKKFMKAVELLFM
jgi:hypothetical protein